MRCGDDIAANETRVEDARSRPVIPGTATEAGRGNTIPVRLRQTAQLPRSERDGRQRINRRLSQDAGFNTEEVKR